MEHSKYTWPHSQTEWLWSLGMTYMYTAFNTRLNGSGLRMRRHSLNHISDQIRNEVASKRYQRDTLILKCMSWDLRCTACDLTPDIKQFTVQPHTTLPIVDRHVHQGPKGGQSSKCHTLICDWDHNL